MTGGRWRAARDAIARDWESGVADLRALLRSPDFHAALWLCVPALVVGAALRLHLCLAAPYGYFLSDTRNFIDSAKEFLESPLSVFGVTTRTFLAPVLYSVPVGLDIPLLRAVPWGQHAVGLGMIVLAGLLCAAWLRHWRWWIVPVTLVVAAHPTLLWYEHMALPESMFVALTLAVAVSVALFQRVPSPPAYLILLASIFLTAGARQEGFLYTVAAIGACLVAFRRDARRLAAYLVASGLFIVVTTSASRTSQGGQLLIASLIQYAPDRLWFTPEYSGRAAALRDHFRPKWPIYPDEHNESRKRIVEDVRAFLIEGRGLTHDEEGRANNGFCKRVAVEIGLRNWWALPRMAYFKWLAMHIEPSSPSFDGEWLRVYVRRKVLENPKSKERKYLSCLFGEVPESDAAFSDALWSRYYPAGRLGALTDWQQRFLRLSLWPQVPGEEPIRLMGPPEAAQKVPLLPWLYPLGATGLLLAGYFSRRHRGQILLWLAMLLFMGFVVCVAGSLRSRYRLAFEPYWYLGLAGLLDTAVILGRVVWARLRGGGRSAEC